MCSHRQSLTQQPVSPADSDSDLFTSQDSPQTPQVAPAILKQFEHMLHKALKQTSDQITSNLTREIRELGKRTAALEVKADDLEKISLEHTMEIENLKEENLLLHT